MDVEKIVVLVSSECKGCDDLIKDMSEENKHMLCDVSSKKCYDIGVRAGIKSIPAVVGEKNGEVFVCKLGKDNKGPIAICGEQEIRL